MTHDEFIAEYKKVASRAYELATTARREGLLSLEDKIDSEKVSQRDILEFGLRFVVDGTDGAIIHQLLSNIIEQEDDKYARQLMKIKKEVVLHIQSGSNSRIILFIINSLTDFSFNDDPFFQTMMEEDFPANDKVDALEKGALSNDEIETLLGGLK